MQQLTELCTLIIGNTHGELAAEIFSKLAECGRLTLIDLQRSTRLPARQLNCGLTILLQHHILLHHAADEDEPTFFSVDWHAAYVLIREPKVIRVVKDRHGDVAGQIVEDLMQAGHATVGEIAEGKNLVPGWKRDSGIDAGEDHTDEEDTANGIADKASGRHDAEVSKLASPSEIHQALHALLQSGLLVKVNPRTYVPAADLEEQAREEIIVEHFPDRKVTGSKKAKEFSSLVNELKRKWQGEDEYSEHRDFVSRGTIKRSKTSKTSNKRVKLNGNLPNGVNHDDKGSEDEDEHEVRSERKLANDMVIRVNFCKCIIALHSQQLERTAENLLGPITASVYGALTRSAEDQIKAGRGGLQLQVADDEEDEEAIEEGEGVEEGSKGRWMTVTDDEILRHLPKSPTLASRRKDAVFPPTAANGNGDHSKPVADEETNLAVDIKPDKDELKADGSALLKERSKRLDMIDTHLEILAEHPMHFCRRIPGQSKSQINFTALAKSLISAELDTIVHARYGRVAARVVRMLREFGKLEEKQIAVRAIKRVKDMRALLTKLQYRGIIDLQELPKDNSRQPSRIAYVWHLDEEALRSRCLQLTYQAMSRTLQRLQVEKDGRFRDVIEKADRLEGREDDMFSKDKTELEKWRAVEEQMLVQLSRLDDIVAVLRDFDGLDTSLTT